MVVHECGDMRPLEAGLHDEEGHWELGIWLGPNQARMETTSRLNAKEWEAELRTMPC